MQPTPKPNNTQPIYEQVIEDIKLRAEAGKQNYGTYLQAGNGRDSLLDAYEEAQDKALYLKQAILERDSLVEELSAVVAEKDRLMRRVDELGCVAACAHGLLSKLGYDCWDHARSGTMHEAMVVKMESLTNEGELEKRDERIIQEAIEKRGLGTASAKKNRPVSHLGQIIRRWRKSCDIHQKDLAKEIGISTSTLCHFENGKKIDGAMMAKVMNWLQDQGSQLLSDREFRGDKEQDDAKD